MADFVREFAGGIVAVVICEEDYLYGTQLDRAYAEAESYEPDWEEDSDDHVESDLDEEDWDDFDPSDPDDDYLNQDESPDEPSGE